MWRLTTLLTLGVALAYAARQQDSQVLAAYAERRPELVSLMVVGPFGIPTHICAGFIVDHETIATAARCRYENDGDTTVDISRLRFRVGSPFWNSGGVVFSVNLYMGYILFHPSNMQRDIAFFGTRSTILFSDSVKPAVIGRYDVAEGELVHSVGWSYLTFPEHLTAQFAVQHEMPQVVANWEHCSSVYAANGFPLLPSTICTELVNQSTITDPESLRQKCFGEAGGPVYHNGFIVGIRSFDVNCSATIPTVNSLASSFIFY